ncbi:MAG: cytochrome b/b6 domain-containing protein [Pseudotabrizicola sp.]|uniref:cytochrome b/b6 domain-containing protein n=1 Tax=Pseudotabrizicola sp. TaxID=2939647 RepID=UPI00273131F9|nr:cytochrome b/b6 domain-containing protein [Pseudotabrizicola sp.]MDP2083125.1 cytochrome b/b6 domain-containing protein [Pseudotabrizicola sp.]MDZ7572543.1 cytochrome b/b6 domain-containing protein [Pseudotabrizicola sp.]
MSARNSHRSYGRVARLFHWTTAALILLAAPLGIIANRLPYDTAQSLAFKAQVFSLHKTLGVVVFFVALGRILWALLEAHPAPLHPERRLELWVARLVHWMLYISLVAVPLTGWVHHAAVTGFAPIWWPFGQGLPFVPQSEAVAQAAGSAHWVFTKLMIVSIILHIAGALKHHVIDRDDTLRRMTLGTLAPANPVPARRTALPLLTAAALFGLGAGVAALPRGEPITTTPTVAAAPAGNWQVSAGTLSIGVAQMGQSVSGSFATWSADITFDEVATNGSHGNVTVTIDTASLTLGSVTTQAKSADFFDTANFPQAIFTANILPAASRYEATGTLTLRGAEVPVTLPFTLTIDGDTATMTGQTSLDRRDFGMGASYGDESSVGFGVVVDVDLTANRS